MVTRASPYVKKRKSEGRQTVAIPESLMRRVDAWAKNEIRNGRPVRSRNDAVNKIVVSVVENSNRKESEDKRLRNRDENGTSN